jgi:protein required for attachment to host cells
MTRARFPHGSLILVCDGAKALLFENAGDARDLNLKLIEARDEFHPPTRELGDDRPTRVYDSMDGSRSGTEQTDWHTEAERAFLRATAQQFDELVAERRARHVAIVAPPKALAVLRGAVAAPTREALVAELARDLVKLPTYEIERHLAALGELE